MRRFIVYTGDKEQFYINSIRQLKNIKRGGIYKSRYNAYQEAKQATGSAVVLFQVIDIRKDGRLFISNYGNGNNVITLKEWEDGVFDDRNIDTDDPGSGGSGGPVQWGDIQNPPSTYPPETHAHLKDQITDFSHEHPISDIPGLDIFATKQFVDDALDDIDIGSSIKDHDENNASHKDIRDIIDITKNRLDGFESLGRWAGTFPTFVDLPGDTSEFIHISENDFIYVDQDETQNNQYTRYFVGEIIGTTIVWGFDRSFGTDITGKVDKADFDVLEGKVQSLDDDFTDHHEDNGIHVSNTDRTAWNGKQEPPKSLAPAYVNSFPNFLAFVRGTPAGVYHIADPDSMPSNTWEDRPRDAWRNDRNIIVIEKVGVGTSMEGVVRVYETTGNAKSVFRTWYEDGWSRPWAEIGGSGTIDDPDISRVYKEHIDAEKKRIDELQPGDHVVSLEMHEPFGDPGGGSINFENHVIEFQPYGGVINLSGSTHNVAIRSFGDVYTTVVPVDDTFVDFSGDWDNVFYAYVGSASGTTKRWDNRELLEAIREIDPESGGRNTFTVVRDDVNYDPANKITALNQSYTVEPDRYGWVRMAVVSTATDVVVTYYKNNIPIKTFGTATGQGLIEIYEPVIPGDVLRMATSNNSAANNWASNPFATTGRWCGCYFIPAKIIWYTSDAAKFNVNLIGPPDYVNMETINRITTNGGSWTVEKDGYVRVGLAKNTNLQASVTINGVQVIGPTDLLHGLMSMNPWFWILPVKAGDVITMVSNPTYCYYIPPTSVAPIALTGVDMVSSTEKGKIYIDPVTKEATINGIEDMGGGGYALPAGGIPKADLSTEVTDLLDEKPNTDTITCLWQGERVILKPNENLMAMTGGLQYELTFMDVPNALDIDLTSHLILDAKLFDPVDELFGFNPGDTYSGFEWMFQEIHNYCDQYGEFDYNDWYDQNIYDYIQQILEMLNIIDQINPRLMSLKMDFQFAVEHSSNPVTVMPIGIYGVKGSNMVLIPHIKTVGGM